MRPLAHPPIHHSISSCPPTSNTRVRWNLSRVTGAALMRANCVFGIILPVWRAGVACLSPESLCRVWRPSCDGCRIRRRPSAFRRHTDLRTDAHTNTVSVFFSFKPESFLTPTLKDSENDVMFHFQLSIFLTFRWPSVRDVTSWFSLFDVHVYMWHFKRSQSKCMQSCLMEQLL